MADLFKERRAVRRYQKKPLTQKQIKQILTAGMYAPSGYDKHPLYFIIVRDGKMKKKLSQVNQWAAHSAGAPVIIVVCADEKQSLVWLEDASIAVGYMWLKCAELGLGACWVHVRDSRRSDGVDCEDYVRRLLKIPSNLRVVCFLVMGRPLKKPSPHLFSEYLINKVYYERWGKKNRKKC